MRTEAGTLVSMLEEGYELDPASISAIVDLSQSLKGKGSLGVVFAALERARDPITRRNCRNLIRALVEASPRLRKHLRNSTKPKGRCKAGARNVILDALDLLPSDATAVSTASVSTPPLAASGELNLTPETTSFAAMPSIYNTLAKFDGANQLPNVRIAEFVYASGLALVATWLNTKPGEKIVVADDTYTREYLRAIGFFDAVEGSGTDSSKDTTDWAVRLTRLDRHARVHQITEDILSIIDTFVAPNAEDRGSFGILLGELIENVTRHANIRTPAFIVAQVYPKRYKLGITIADAGIGIRQSFIEGDVEKYRDPAKPDEFFISLALQPLVTSKASAHAGYGLYILSELISRNQGSYMVTSGPATVVGYRARGMHKQDVYRHAPWEGTVVSMIVNLQTKLPLSDVYKSLPLPVGFSAEDFFEE